jgi:hypothetical protein
MITLQQALTQGKLDEFVAQAEADSVGPADRAQFEKMVGRVTAPLPEGQTSHLPAGDCSHGK